MSNERIDLDQLEEEIANLQDMHFDTRLDERVANANMFNRILNELAKCYQREDVASEALLENAEMMRGYVGQIIEIKRKIRDMIDVCEGVDSLFGEEVIGMLQDLLV